MGGLIGQAMRSKICGFTREQDVLAAVELGVDALGFVFDRGSRCLDPKLGERLLAAARGGDRSPQCIAVIGQLSTGEVAPLRALGFDGIQAGVEPWRPVLADDATYLLPAFFDTEDLVTRVAQHRIAHPAAAWNPEGESLEGLVNLDSAGGGGTGTQPDWQRAAEVCAAGPTMIAGGLTADNVADRIARTGAAAVDVCSGVELSAGIIDTGAMAAFVAAVRGS